MSEIHPVIHSFNGGELSPRMAGRFDQPNYHAGCKTLENAICSPQGPAYRRGAFRFVNETKTSAKASRLLPFEVGEDQAYVLEMGDQYVRFYKDGSRIESGGSPVELAVPYLEADLFSLHHAQSADLLYLTEQSYPVGRIARLAASGLLWSYKEAKFNPPPLFEDDTDISGGTISISLNAISGTGVQCLSSADAFLAADKDRLIISGDGLASITAVVGAREVTLEIIDSFPSAYAPAAGPGTITTVGTAAAFSAPHGLAAGDWVRLTSGPQSGQKRRVDALVDPSNATLASAFTVDQVAQSWSKDKEITAATGWKLKGSPVSTLTPTVDKPTGAVTVLAIADAGWRAVDVTLGKYVRVNDGIVKLTTYTNPTSVSGVIQKTLSSKNPSPGGAWSAEIPAWSAVSGYPATCCFFEQRFIAAGSVRQPSSIWGSQVGDYQNMGIGVLDADAFVYPLTELKNNSVRWLMPAKVLHGGTVSGEFSLTGGTDNSLTPTNKKASSETTHGSNTVRPIRVGHVVLFVQARGRKVREVTYNLQEDSFVAPDLARFADHIAAGGIVDMAYQQEPDSIIWAVRADGTLLGITYVRDEKVYGWHRHVTDGAFESVCVIPDPANHRDQLWVVVRRTIGGATKRFIEVLDPDATAADSYVRYQGAATVTIPGLTHLEGKAVDIVADGFVVRGETVTGGVVTLDKAASDVYVGLRYDSTVQPNRPDYVDDRGGTTIGRKKQWTEVILRLKDTGLSGVTVNGSTIPSRSGADGLNVATGLFTGDVKVPKLGTDNYGDLVIKQTLPLPLELLAITGSLDVGD